jgi:putative peptidoglycan lipid II flippase
LVVALFQRGEFTALAARETARALAWQGGAIWTVAVVRQTVPVFYALGDARTPVLVSAIDLCVFVALAVGLKDSPLGHVGISVAVAGSSAVQMLLLLGALRRRLGPLGAREILLSAGRSLVGSLVAGGAALAAERSIVSWSGPSSTHRAAPGLVAAVVFAAVFLLVAWRVRSPEFDGMVRGLRRRWSRA